MIGTVMVDLTRMVRSVDLAEVLSLARRADMILRMVRGSSR